MFRPKKITTSTFYEHGVQIEDLPEDLQAMAEIVGLDVMFKILILFGGETLYFLQMDTVMRHGRNREINKRFDGSNHRELSKKFGISIRHIRKIVQHEKDVRL